MKLEVSFKDKDSHKTIAMPFFFQNANAFASAWSFGPHDRSIPERIAALFERYMIDNYTALEGGATGKDKESLLIPSYLII